MKLHLSKEWYEKQIHPEEDFEIGAGVAPNQQENGHAPSETDTRQRRDDEPIVAFAFGTLIQLLRRDRRLTVDQLATDAQVDVAEIVRIECDPKHIPQSSTVQQLAHYFQLPDRVLLKLFNTTIASDPQLREAAYRFAAQTSNIAELSHQERAAMTEFVQFLGSMDDR